MKVDLITETHSDLTVVNAARCSFDKESSWIHGDHLCYDHDRLIPPSQCRNKAHYELSKADSKLITYLAKHNHWTPFAHPQEVFELAIDGHELLYFLIRANLSGFEWSPNITNSTLKIRGSLYAWLTNSEYLPNDIAHAIESILNVKYPVSTQAVYGMNVGCDESSRVKHIDQNTLDSGHDLSDELEHYTLRIHCPIFVKRQLETHRRNLVMTDIEDLAQNEVSRRYVDSEPEIYHPDKWRIQSKDKKQGSLGELDPKGVEAILVDSNYSHHTHNAMLYYEKMNNLGIAHEQSRMILPQSTYTTFWWTGSTKSFKRVISLRCKPDTQHETKLIAEKIAELLSIPVI